ncbi:MAG: hypothetical protein MPI95_01595 [Nitrosopumilus sp.]|nr:hypothetical protein [Nitrosopumilus sp.]MDA7942677.1 hypothetical protein [Nitrosopumilus sp.]MDA7945802.1 hypothetical protein [Nitrosopumilus sp.]MDA7952802.1 hypothetical protein [Nitrosopumilus sp.]MDA7957775.1 hypothetical protein [Nitrosopumilus sp.]
MGKLLPACAAALLAACAAPAASGLGIEMEREVFGYCERLSYVITVDEVTGDPAYVVIRDSGGTAGSPVPLPVASETTVETAPFPFEREVFPEGSYEVAVSYAGMTAEAGFEVADLGIVCIPGTARQVVLGWAAGGASDGFMVDALQRYVGAAMIPFEIEGDIIYEISLPGWVRGAGALWAAGQISDADLIGIINYVAGRGLLLPGEGGQA